MAVTIAQSPLSTVGFSPIPIGQQIIFSVSENLTVANNFKVKFIAEVHISNTAINLSNSNDLIGTFKTTPNNAGVGIFDLRPVLETFVKSDNEGSTFGNGSRYKQSSSIPVAQAVPHPLHLINEFAVSENAVRYMAIQFKVEWAETAGGDIESGLAVDSDQYIFFNGVLQYDDVLTLDKGNYGFNLFASTRNFFLADTGKFLSNAPSTQYARLTDYGTLPFLNFLPTAADKVTGIVLTYYWDGGSSTETVNQTWTNGGVTNFGSRVVQHLLYFGAFPGNLQNWSTTFASAITSGLTHYTIQANSDIGTTSQMTTINIICPNERGYEGIRLTWLNQWGVWDYYTFNMKSTRAIATKRIPYTQLGGTWNDSTFKISGYKGGKKNFRVNSTEKIKLNTDFVSEEEGVWFEELINSPEVYIVNGFSADAANTITNKYIDPVTLTTSSYVKKTIANDKLMQYTIEIEKSKMKRTQAV
tara:strand:+ start:1091 stop:2506 length:1416 start_codon:yes stop_codon:yes gene_type:complete